MARYIDADVFLKKIERYSLSNGTTLGKHSGVADEIIDILTAEPTAAVAPRAEVAREILKEVRQSLLCMVIANSMGEQYDLEARFVEIEKKYKGD